MTIFVAPIGVKTDHVKGWLKEESRDVTILWLIHSKKSPKWDFPKIAKKLEKDLKLSYPQIEIKKAILENAFRADPTIDTILKIILTEEKLDPLLIRNEFILNINIFQLNHLLKLYSSKTVISLLLSFVVRSNLLILSILPFCRNIP